ncbi:MAG TPA: hypothetical protein VFH27_07740 [Longimicrobiaceae bacterium]|nr:hypothetical protein [Longimicrobiaceae bacterium]
MNTASFGVQELDAQSIRLVNGGEESGGVVSVLTWIGEQVIENWDHVKAGFSDGYNGTGYKPR